MENNIGALIISVISSGVLASTIAAIANAKKTKSEATRLDIDSANAGVTTSITTLQQVVDVLTKELNTAKSECAELRKQVWDLQQQIIELQKTQCNHKK